MFRNILKLSVPKLAKKTAALRIPSFHSRALSTIKVTYVEPDGNEVTLTADPNADDKPTLMTLAVKNKVDMEGACEGQIACSTCHVILPKEVYDQLAKTNPISDEELDMLDTAFGLTPTSRLGCQIPLSALPPEIKVKIPSYGR